MVFLQYTSSTPSAVATNGPKRSQIALNGIVSKGHIFVTGSPLRAAILPAAGPFVTDSMPESTYLGESCFAASVARYLL